jgi:hypothetical protein
MLVSCDIEDSYVIEEWYVYDYVDDGVILRDGGIFNVKYLETDDLTSEDVEIGEKVYLRIYESGDIEAVRNHEEQITEIEQEDYLEAHYVVVIDRVGEIGNYTYIVEIIDENNKVFEYDNNLEEWDGTLLSIDEECILLIEFDYQGNIKYASLLDVS